jgi:phosphopantothenoylcysteine synthetase/decarboxylase
MPRGRPVLLAPAMNTEMWYDPAVEETVRALVQTAKYTLLLPRTSRLHCGDVGIGAQAQVADIVTAVRRAHGAALAAQAGDAAEAVRQGVAVP